MWIESILGHSFLACNLLWPCSLIETSDTELSGIHWSRKVSYLKSRVSHWSGEKQRRLRDTTRRARGCQREWVNTYRTPSPVVVYIDDSAKISALFSCVDKLSGELLCEVDVVTAAAPLPAFIAHSTVPAVTIACLHLTITARTCYGVRHPCRCYSVREGRLSTCWKA